MDEIANSGTMKTISAHSRHNHDTLKKPSREPFDWGFCLQVFLGTNFALAMSPLWVIQNGFGIPMDVWFLGILIASFPITWLITTERV